MLSTVCLPWQFTAYLVLVSENQSIVQGVDDFVHQLHINNVFKRLSIDIDYMVSVRTNWLVYNKKNMNYYEM